MKRNILQVPISTELQNSAKKAAEKQGFSSLQDVVRLLLAQFATGAMRIRIESADEERLSPKAEKRYAKIKKDILSGKVKTTGFDSVDKMMDYLNT